MAVVQLTLALVNGVSGVLRGIGQDVSDLAAKVLSLSDAFDVAGGFEDSLAAVQAVTGATAEEFAKLKAAAEAAGTSTRFSATEAADGLSELARAGLDANQSIAALNPSLNLAQGNSIAVAQAAELLTTSITQFGLSAEDATRVADVLQTTADKTATSVQQMGNALSYVAPLAKGLGLTIEETSAILGRLANEGFRGERAGTALRAMFVALGDPASKFSEALDGLGIKSRDFATIITELGKRGAAGTAALRTLGVEALPAIQALVDKGGAGIRQLTTDLQGAEGAAQRTADIMGATLNGALDRLNNTFQTVQSRFLEPLLAPLSGEVNTLAAELDKFSQSPAFAAIRQQFAEFVLSGIEKLRDLVSEIDFDALTNSLIKFAKDAVPAVQGLADAAVLAADAVSLIGNAVGLVKNTVVGGLNVIEAGVSAFAEGTAKGIRGIGVESEALDGVITTLSETTQTNIGEIGASFSAAGENAAGLGVSIEEVGAASESAAIGIGKLAESQERVAATLPPLKDSLQALGVVAKAIGDGITDAFNKTPQGARIAAQSFRDLAATAEASGLEILESFRAALDTSTTRAQVEALQQELTDLAAEGRLTGQELDQAFVIAQNRLKQIEVGTGDLTAAFEKLKIKSQEALNLDATQARAAFDAIKAGAAAGTASVVDVRNAFEAYARVQLAAAEGADDWKRRTIEAALRNEAAAIGATDALQRLGLAGKEAGEKVAAGATQATEALQETQGAATSASQAIGGIVQPAAAAAGGLTQVEQAASRAGGELGFLSQEFINAANASGSLVDATGAMNKELEAQIERYQRQLRGLREQAAAYDPLEQAINRLQKQYPALSREALKAIADQEVALARLREQADETAKRVQSSSRGGGAPNFGQPLPPPSSGPPSFRTPQPDSAPVSVTVVVQGGLFSTPEQLARVILPELKRIARSVGSTALF